MASSVICLLSYMFPIAAPRPQSLLKSSQYTAHAGVVINHSNQANTRHTHAESNSPCSYKKLRANSTNNPVQTDAKCTIVLASE